MERRWEGGGGLGEGREERGEGEIVAFEEGAYVHKHAAE